MDLQIANGEEVFISNTQPGRFREAIVKVVPKSVTALRALLRLSEPGTPINIRDDSMYNIVNEAPGYVELGKDQANLPGGWSIGLFRSVLSSIEGNDLPPTVLLEQKMREPMLDRNRLRAVSRPESRSGFIVGPTLRKLRFDLPEWLRELRVWMPWWELNDIIVGRGATLTLGGPSIHMQARNLYIYQGGRIKQEAMDARIELKGSLKGDVA
jgi:hypothetical protein